MNRIKLTYFILIYFTATIINPTPAIAGVRCVKSTLPTCVVPIYSLYGVGAEGYERFTIVTYGFMSKDGDNYFISPDKSSSSFLLPHQSIKLVFDENKYGVIMSMINNNYVQVVGNIKFSRNSTYWADLVLTSEPVQAIRIGE